LKVVAQQSGQYKSCSDFIEAALWAYIAQMVRNQENDRDLDIINRHVDYLNE